jgi:hypothetical protein
MNSSEPFAWHDPDSSSWKMSLPLFPTDSQPYLGSWPRSGMTANGRAYVRQIWAPATAGTAGGLLRTPTCGMVNQDRSQDPQYMSKLLAKGQTVTLAAQMKSAEMLPIGPDGTPGLPTPSACIANDGERPETWLARRERVKLTAKNGNGMGMPLTIAAQLLPTPCAQTSKGGPKGLDGGSGARQMLGTAGFPPTGAATYLNPSFVEEMMGFPLGWTD